jgi:hypothetical protein
LNSAAEVQDLAGQFVVDRVEVLHVGRLDLAVLGRHVAHVGTAPLQRRDDLLGGVRLELGVARKLLHLVLQALQVLHDLCLQLAVASLVGREAALLDRVERVHDLMLEVDHTLKFRCLVDDLSVNVTDLAGQDNVLAAVGNDDLLRHVLERRLYKLGTVLVCLLLAAAALLRQPVLEVALKISGLLTEEVLRDGLECDAAALVDGVSLDHAVVPVAVFWDLEARHVGERAVELRVPAANTVRVLDGLVKPGLDTLTLGMRDDFLVTLVVQERMNEGVLLAGPRLEACCFNIVVNHVRPLATSTTLP